MEKPTLHLHSQNFNHPDQIVDMNGFGTLNIIQFDDGSSVVRAIYRPGWTWEKHERPLFGTESCQLTHRGCCLSGKMAVQMDDGEEFEFTVGDAIHIPPGHKAHVVGNEPVEIILVMGPWDEQEKEAESGAYTLPRREEGEHPQLLS